MIIATGGIGRMFNSKTFGWGLALLLFIVVPFLIQLHLHPLYNWAVVLTPGNHDTWVQFWGSYLGIIPSGLIAFLVSTSEIKASEKADRRNHILEMYLDDLRLMRNKFVQYPFKGGWPSYYFEYDISFEGFDIEFLQQLLLKPVADENGKKFLATEPKDILLIADGLPQDKRKLFLPLAQNLVNEINRFATYDSKEFDDLADAYRKAQAKNGGTEIGEKRVHVAKNDWRNRIVVVVDHLTRIAEAYEAIVDKMQSEINLVYVLDSRDGTTRE